LVYHRLYEEELIKRGLIWCKKYIFI
jgi:hypothetical protein